MAMEERETFSLIGSDKVEGTNVYGANGEKVGYIERVMIDKVSGKVSYAVLSFGGLLGIGDDHYPLFLAGAEIRHQPRRLRHRHHPGPTPRRPQIRRRKQLELERSRHRTLRECLLRCPGGLRRGSSPPPASLRETATVDRRGGLKVTGAVRVLVVDQQLHRGRVARRRFRGLPRLPSEAPPSQQTHPVQRP